MKILLSVYYLKLIYATEEKFFNHIKSKNNNSLDIVSNVGNTLLGNNDNQSKQENSQQPSLPTIPKYNPEYIDVDSTTRSYLQHFGNLPPREEIQESTQEETEEKKEGRKMIIL